MSTTDNPESYTYAKAGVYLPGVRDYDARDLTPADAARIRGLADQMALRVAHHDPAAHAKTRPQSGTGQPVYDVIKSVSFERS